MDKFKELTTGAKLVLGATIAFLIFSFFEWFEIGGELGDAVEAVAGDNGITMWNGIGWVAGLLAIALIVWQALRLANIEFEVGVTPAMITAALALLIVIFTFIRFIDTPNAFDRTFWAWLGLLLSIVIAVGAWMNMKASGESFADVRDRVSSMTGGSGTASTPAADTGPPSAPAETAPPSAAEPAAGTDEPASGEETSKPA